MTDQKTTETPLTDELFARISSKPALDRFAWMLDHARKQEVALTAQKLREEAQALREAELELYVKAWKAEASLMEHKVITCGVIASHSDATLGDRPPYSDKWNSQQADYVRALRKREAELAKALKDTQEGLSFVLKHLSEDKPATFPNKWWNDLSMIEASARAALHSPASQNNPKETKA